jgi:hypothetical protein
MQPAALFLLLLLPPADTTGDMAAGIQASLRQQLGDVTMAIAPDTLVTPAMWQGSAAPMRARFVARIAWLDKNQMRVELLSAQATASHSRALTFAPQDAKPERGRAVGLVVAELLRESPAAAFATPGPTVAAVSAPATAPARLALGAACATERALTNHWAIGPKLTYDLGLGEALRIEARGMALFAGDQYSDLGFGLGARWDFLRSSQARHALGLAVGADGFRESVAGGEDNHGTPSKWNAALVVGLAGRVTLWRWLRAVVEADFRVVSGGMTLQVGDDATRRTYEAAHWRPGFSLGLEAGL